MDYRPLGRTGVQVSKLCLGTMMFGAWGNTDHDDSIRIIHAALDAGINFVDTADVYSAGESEEIVGKALEGPPRRRRPGHQVLHADGRGPQPPRRLAPLDHHARSRTRCGGSAPTGSTSTRSTAPTRTIDVEETLGALTDLVQQGKVRYIGSSSYSGSQIVEAQWAARERNLRALPHRAAALLAADPRASSSTSCPPRSATAWASSPTARSPAAGCRAAGAPTARRPRRRGSGWPRASTCRCPRTSASSKPSSSSPQVADDAGLSMIELAIAFVVNHPGVTSAIIGPRTMEQLDSQLPGRRRSRSTPAILDRIDEIVKPGVNLNPADTSYGEQVLDPVASEAINDSSKSKTMTISQSAATGSSDTKRDSPSST